MECKGPSGALQPPQARRRRGPGWDRLYINMSPSQKCITIPLRASAAAAFSLALLALFNVARASAAPQATFYVVDIGHGNVAFVVAPSGETMLLDCGPPQMADRIYDFMRPTGIEKID